ncbi:MAG: membrane protein insertase YidC [Planctomycetota bacterium]
MTTLDRLSHRFVLILSLVSLLAFGARAQEAEPVPVEDLVEAPAPDFPSYSPRLFLGVGTSAPLAPLPDDPEAIDPDAIDSQLSIEFSNYAAGIASLRLTDYRITTTDPARIEIQRIRTAGDLNAIPYSAIRLEVVPGDAPRGLRADQWSRVDLAVPGVWRPDPAVPGRFTAEILDEDGALAFELERVFSIEPDSYEVELRQSVRNVGAGDVRVRWVQAGPGDLPEPESTYAGDKRRVRFGYLRDEATQGSSMRVSTDTDLESRSSMVLGSKGAYRSNGEVWVATQEREAGRRLVWFGLTDRYFAVATHRLFDPATLQGPSGKLFNSVDRIRSLILNRDAGTKESAVVLTQLESPPIPLPQGAAANLSIGIYAGPLYEPAIESQAVAPALSLGELVQYNLGGPCAFCTFGFLSEPLIGVLRLFDGFIGDFAFAIMLLVLVVRTALHPITHWTQVRMARFGVQMQGVAPKMKQLKERFEVKEHDTPEAKAEKQKKMQAEMAALWREEGINPLSALGCLPMLLQSPIWIALYATLYFAFDLRHEAAFFGVFQQVIPDWRFLADLSTPDAAIPIGAGFSLPLLGRFDAINILPAIMALVYWLQQKYLAPPTTGTMTPEQEQQQKIMRFMIVFMFPLIMYNAPSGLLIYFITNSTLGVVESKWIRSRAKARGLLDPDKIKAEKLERRARQPKKGGFMEKIRRMAEEQQRIRAEQQGMKVRKVQNTAETKPGKPTPSRYKKRK